MFSTLLYKLMGKKRELITLNKEINEKELLKQLEKNEKIQKHFEKK